MRAIHSHIEVLGLMPAPAPIMIDGQGGGNLCVDVLPYTLGVRGRVRLRIAVKGRVRLRIAVRGRVRLRIAINPSVRGLGAGASKLD